MSAIVAAQDNPANNTAGARLRPASSNIRFAFLSFRPFRADFRRYLALALEAEGHPCVHLFLGRGRMEARTGAEFDERTPIATLNEAAEFVRRFFGGSPGIVINGAGNSGPDVVLRLWLRLRDFAWIYDVFDWFLYDARGLKRIQWWLTIEAYRMTASRCCVLSEDLVGSYPKSFQFQNASHLVPSPRPKAFDNKVVITAYYDRRTDFALIEAVAKAAPDLTLDMYGSVYNDDPQTVLAIERLTARCKNVRYYGRFEFDALQQILDNYMIGLVPYRANDAMTRFISPDKVYHYLCAGLEVVSTPLPAVRYLEPYVHVAPDVNATLAAIRHIASGGERRNPGDFHETFNWRARARYLCEAVAPTVTASTFPSPQG